MGKSADATIVQPLPGLALQHNVMLPVQSSLETFKDPEQTKAINMETQYISFDCQPMPWHVASCGQ